jgi:hypothetical protein
MARSYVTFEKTNDSIREEIYTDVIQEFDYIADLPLSDDQKQAILGDIVEYIFRELQNQPVCECNTYGGIINVIRFYKQIFRKFETF